MTEHDLTNGSSRGFSVRRPLDSIGSIKSKLSIVIVAAVAMTATTSQLGYWLDWPVWIRPFVAGAAALLMVQFLARGLTRPLRTMATAATSMSTGDYNHRVIATSRDEVGQLAQAFNAMADDLRVKDRDQKEFIANASHELRTPVAALRSTLENLVDGVGQADTATLSRLLARAEHLSDLVSQLLDLSRLESGLTSLQIETLDVGDLLQAVAEEVMAAQPRSTVVVRSPVDLKIQGETARIRQVFVNVIGNAARFSHPGEEITVTATQNNGTIGVAVRDTGPGISEEERAKVFERFWQADGTARTGAGGAGLGLAISKQIIDRHHGSIEVVGNEPRGACFVVTLPRNQKFETSPEPELPQPTR